MNLALMIIDLQKAFYDDETRHSMDSAREYINSTLAVFRKAKLPVFWIQHIDEEAGLLPETEEFELINLLQPLEGEHRIHKKYGNSFNKTNCIDLIREEHVDTLILTGYCAEYCVLSTYRGALDLDLTPIILKNAIASNNQKNISFVEDISELITYGVLKKIVEEKG